jgi:hypothetical protein
MPKHRILLVSHIALASSRYGETESLKAKDNFYDYEKSFDQIWQDLGRLYLENHMNEQSSTRDQRKKTLLPCDYLQPVEEKTAIEGQLEILPAQAIDPEYEKLTVFRERMLRYQKYLFPFLYDWKIPPDNNASEKAVRTFKVKQKVSGLFRSPEGTNAFAIIRSVIDTAIKNAQNVLKALAIIALLIAAK